MADPLGQVFEGREGSGLAQIIGTKGIAPSDALQRAVADEKKKQATAEKKRMAGIGMAMKLLDNSKIGGWAQDRNALKGGHAALRRDITETMARDGEGAYDVSTEAGWNNMLRLQGGVAEFAAANKYSGQQQDLFNNSLEEYVKNPDQYDEKSLKALEDYKNMPLSQRLDAEVPVLTPVAVDWRKHYGDDKVIDNFVNKFGTAKEVEGGAVESITGTNLDKKRIFASAQNDIESYQHNKFAGSVYDEVRTMILGDPAFSRIHNDEDAINTLIITPGNELKGGLKEFASENPELSLGAQQIIDFQTPKISKSFKKTLTKKQTARGATDEDVFARVELIDGIQKGDPDSLSGLKGKFREGRIVDVEFDPDRGLVTYTWETKDRTRETRSIDIKEEAGGGIGEINNLLNEIQGTRINEEDFTRREQAQGGFVSRREAPERNVDFDKVNRDVDIIRKSFDPSRKAPFFEFAETPATKLLEATPGITNIKFTREPDILRFRLNDDIVEINLEDSAAHNQIRNILINQNKDKYLITPGTPSTRGAGWKKVTQGGDLYWYNADTGESEFIGPAK